MTIDIEVIDNFLSTPYFKLIQERIHSIHFPWFFRKNITGEDQKDNLPSFGFDNLFIEKTHSLNNELTLLMSGFLGNLLELSKFSIVHRCRFDMTVYTNPKYKHTPHVDLYGDHLASVFYISNSDGETEIYNEKCFSEDEYFKLDLNKLTLKRKIEPKENRLLIFNGTYLHTGHSPSQSKNRIIVNTNLFE